MKRTFLVSGIVTVLATLGSQACTLGSDTYITSEPGITASYEGDGGAKGEVTPSTLPASSGGDCAFVTPDLGKLTPCGDGKGHCYDAAKTPHADMFGPCPSAGQVCVPDEVLEAGGKTLQACNSGIGEGGGCITIALVPAMDADPRARQFLKQDVCDADQICAPCINPEANGASTGVCEPTGVRGECASSAPAPATDGGASGKPLPTCCSHGKTSGGVCIGEALIPEDQRSDAPEDTCKDGDRCVPKALFEGKPVTCNSGLLGGGVCLDTCFNEMMGFASTIGILGKDRCGDTEVCVPCTFVSGKGVPGCE